MSNLTDEPGQQGVPATLHPSRQQIQTNYSLDPSTAVKIAVEDINTYTGGIDNWLPKTIDSMKEAFSPASMREKENAAAINDVNVDHLEPSFEYDLGIEDSLEMSLEDEHISNEPLEAPNNASNHSSAAVNSNLPNDDASNEDVDIIADTLTSVGKETTSMQRVESGRVMGDSMVRADVSLLNLSAEPAINHPEKNLSNNMKQLSSKNLMHDQSQQNALNIKDLPLDRGLTPNDKSTVAKKAQEPDTSAVNVKKFPNGFSAIKQTGKKTPEAEVIAINNLSKETLEPSSHAAPALKSVDFQGTDRKLPAGLDMYTSDDVNESLASICSFSSGLSNARKQLATPHFSWFLGEDYCKSRFAGKKKFIEHAAALAAKRPSANSFSSKRPLSSISSASSPSNVSSPRKRFKSRWIPKVAPDWKCTGCHKSNVQPRSKIFCSTCYRKHLKRQRKIREQEGGLDIEG